MKFVEALKQKGAPFIIPDCSRSELPQFFKDIGYEVGAEIGAHKAEFTAEFCEVGLEMFVIDPWIGFSGQGRHQKEQAVQDDYFRIAMNNLEPYDKYRVLRKTSMDALEDVKDGSLGFIYIDGNHNFRHAAADIFEWSKKVKTGGIVAGHDYFDTASHARNVVCNVKAVLDAYTKAFDIDNWYIYKPDKPKNANDKVYSWLFIKK